MIGTVRYTFARCLGSQRWIPPLLIFTLSVAIFYPFNSPALGAGSVGSLLLIPISSWLMITAVNSEDESQMVISVVNVGGFVRYRIGLMLAVISVASGLAAFSISFALIRDTPIAGSNVVQTVLALLLVHLTCACVGTGFGLLIAPPIVTRSGFAFVLVGTFSIVAIALPNSPFRNLIGALNNPDFAHFWQGISILSAQALVVGLIFAAIGLYLARRRA